LPADLTIREIGVLTPLAILCVYIGFQFHTLTDAMQRPIEQTLAAYPAEVRAHAVMTAQAGIQKTRSVNSPIQSPNQEIAQLPNPQPDLVAQTSGNPLQ
jgi:hypothetical protein